MDDSGNTAGSPRPRSAGSLLLSPVFGSFFTARLLTAIGTWLHGIVAAIAAYDLTGSALTVGTVSIAQFAPQLILGPMAGRWADQGSIKRQMILGRSITIFGSLGMAAWYLSSAEMPTWILTSAITISSLIVGIGLVVGGPSMQAAVPALVKHDELPAAMALNSAPVTVGRIAGPAFGALATASLGYGWAFAMAAAANVLFIAMISWITFPNPPGLEKGERHSIREAIAFVRSDRPMLLTLIGVTALGFGSEPSVTLAPPLAAELGGTTVTVGALTSSMGIGAALGVAASSVFAHRIRHDRMAFAGIVAMVVSAVACAVPMPQLGAMAAFMLNGLGFIVAITSLSTILQLRMPPLMRGRIMALWLMGFVGLRPLSSLMVGALTDAFNVHVAFACVAVVLLISAAICRPSQLRIGEGGATAPDDHGA